MWGEEKQGGEEPGDPGPAKGVESQVEDFKREFCLGKAGVRGGIAIVVWTVMGM